jgi:mono/diheme cytochrome c family protein
LIGFSNEAPISLNEGIFSKDQAKSGKRLYKKHCQSCHEGSYFKPVLLAWRGESLSSLFKLITSAMPENDPGALEQDQYTDILAHILNISGYPRGGNQLNPTTFSGITIDKPAAK